MVFDLATIIQMVGGYGRYVVTVFILATISLFNSGKNVVL